MAVHTTQVRSRDFDLETMCDNDKARWDEAVYLVHDLLGSGEVSQSFQYPELVGTEIPEPFAVISAQSILRRPEPLKFVDREAARNAIRRYFVSQSSTCMASKPKRSQVVI